MVYAWLFRRPRHSVVVGAATKYLVTSSNYDPTAGAGVTISAQLVDANNHSVATAGLVVTWTKTDSGGSFGSPTSTTDATGLATVTFTTNAADVATTVTGTDTNSMTGTSATIQTHGGSITPDATMTTILNGLLDNGTIEFYTGTAPRSTADAAGATLLATLTFSVPAGANPPDMIQQNKMNLHVTGTAFVIRDGTVAWARVRKPNGVGIYDGVVGLTGSGEPFIVSTASLAWTTGQTLTQSALTATTGT